MRINNSTSSTPQPVQEKPPIDYNGIKDLKVVKALNEMQRDADKVVSLDGAYQLSKPFIEAQEFENLSKESISNTLKEQLQKAPALEKKANEMKEKISTAKEELKSQQENYNKLIDDQIKNNEDFKSLKKDLKKQDGIYNLTKEQEEKFSAIKQQLDTQKLSLEKTQKNIQTQEKKLEYFKKDNIFFSDSLSQKLVNNILDASDGRSELLQSARVGLIRAYQDLVKSSDKTFPDFTFSTANQTLQKLDQTIFERGEHIIDLKA